MQLLQIQENFGWQAYSLVMFGSSVILYLFIRYLQKQNFDTNLISYAVGSGPLSVIAIYFLLSKKSLYIDFHYLLIIFVNAIFFSFFGNYISVKAIKLAPNSGYSLAIQKSYAPYTTLVSLLLFSESISFAKFVAFIIIIISIGQILVEPIPQTKKSDIKWILYSWMAFFAFGNLVLINKYLLVQGLDAFVILFYTYLFATIPFSAKIISIRRNIKFTIKKDIGGLVIIAVLSSLFNIFMQLGIKSSPNIGYVNILNASSISVITILSAFLFKDKLTIQKLLGILGVFCGMILLFI